MAMILLRRSRAPVSVASSTLKKRSSSTRTLSSLAAHNDTNSSSTIVMMLADYNFGPCDIVQQIMVASSQNNARFHSSLPQASAASPLSRWSHQKPSSTTQCRRHFSTTESPPPSLDGYYHIEVSNGLDDDATDDDGHLQIVYATKITVQGPDVDGILASMTVALAMKGCSLVSLHAAKSEDMGWREQNNKDDDAMQEESMIKDVFYVVDRLTGQPFADDELYELAESLLDALAKPMAMIGGPSTSLKEPTLSSAAHIQKKHATPPYPTREEQITVIKGGGG